MTLNNNYELRKGLFKNYEDLTFTYIYFEAEEITNIEIKFETFREVLFKKCQ